jgi:adenosylcobinamide kinase / adenosylcobinamide-phosphate guanylyltransferase
MSRRLLPAVTLVLGGARSGKSVYAEALVERHAGECLYIATGEARDAEMLQRIREHRARRGARWRTIEEPLDLIGALRQAAGPDCAVLIDCLTLWLANLLEAGRDIEGETAKLTAVLRAQPMPVVLVANEVGLGVVPETALGRGFRDHAGRVNQAVAAAAEAVVLMVAGIAMPIKPAT